MIALLNRIAFLTYAKYEHVGKQFPARDRGCANTGLNYGEP